MDARTGWTIALTALSGPVGAVATGAALARIADATQGGMAGLAAGVGGLFIGGPIFALAVFTICVLALARPRRRGVSITCMLGACVVDGVAVLLGLAAVARTEASEAGLIAVALVSMGVLGVGAWLALKVGNSRRRAQV